MGRSLSLILLLFSFGKMGCDIASLNEVCLDDQCSSSFRSSKERYRELRLALDNIKTSCGEICDTTTMTGVPGKYYDYMTKQVDCQALFTNEFMDRKSEFDEPPLKIPKYLMSDFTYQGKVEYRDTWYDDSKGSTHMLTWTKEVTEWIRTAFRSGNLKGPYGIDAVNEIYRHLTSEHMDVTGKQVLVIGSQSPWIEVLLLEAGARHVYTMDYLPIVSEYPNITTMTADEMSAMFLNKTLPKFDAIMSYSSVEHSGLGRYGDALNPWGDLIAMSRAWCMLESGGRAMIGMPVGPDILGFNGCRIYGPVMLPHLFANWKQVYSEVNFDRYSEQCIYCYQPLFVLEKP